MGDIQHKAGITLIWKEVYVMGDIYIERGIKKVVGESKEVYQWGIYGKNSGIWKKHFVNRG